MLYKQMRMYNTIYRFVLAVGKNHRGFISMFYNCFISIFLNYLYYNFMQFYIYSGRAGNEQVI